MGLHTGTGENTDHEHGPQLCGRTTDPDITFGSRTSLDITMAAVGSNRHPFLGIWKAWRVLKFHGSRSRAM